MEVIIQEGAEMVGCASRLTCMEVLSREKSSMVNLARVNLL
jgi:hypothetical protein